MNLPVIVIAAVVTTAITLDHIKGPLFMTSPIASTTAALRRRGCVLGGCLHERKGIAHRNLAPKILEPAIAPVRLISSSCA